MAQATADAGMRALCGQTVLKFPTPDAESYEDSLALAREFINKWHGHPLIVPAPAPHAPYTCTAEILRACAELAVEFDVPIHIHLSRDRARGGAVAQEPRHAGGALGQEAGPVRRARAARALRARRRGRDAHDDAMRAPAWRTTRRATSSWGRASRPSPRCWRLASTSASAPMVPHRTTTSTCSRRCGWRRCWPRERPAIRRCCRHSRRC